jgi:hypothetical protein
MIAKCGEHNVWHWAHRGTRTCDPWWEQTEWHLAWKNQFPEDWQEKPHRSQDGEMHIADVKTDRGVVIEFQHSHLDREERESRENFYQKIVWVVDGLRRVLDKSRFFELLARASIVKTKKSNQEPGHICLRGQVTNRGQNRKKPWCENHKAKTFKYASTERSASQCLNLKKSR